MELSLSLLLLWAGASTDQALRYLIPAASISALLASWPSLRALRLQTRECPRHERRRDLLRSLAFCGIAAALVGPAHLTGLGGTKLYADVGRYGWPYLGFSIFAILAIHDAYFYWTHRLLHWPPLYRLAHRQHHEAKTPSAWTAFAFHPVEAVVQAAIYPTIAFAIPVHTGVFALFLAWAALHSVLIHSGHDLLLLGNRRGAWRWLYSAVDHDAHHAGVRGEYALYFSFWDTVMGTRAEPGAPAPLAPRALEEAEG